MAATVWPQERISRKIFWDAFTRDLHLAGNHVEEKFACAFVIRCTVEIRQSRPRRAGYELMHRPLLERPCEVPRICRYAQFRPVRFRVVHKLVSHPLSKVILPQLPPSVRADQRDLAKPAEYCHIPSKSCQTREVSHLATVQGQMPDPGRLSTPIVAQHVGPAGVQSMLDVYRVGVEVDVPVRLKASPLFDSAELKLLASHFARQVADVYQNTGVEENLG